MAGRHVHVCGEHGCFYPSVASFLPFLALIRDPFADPIWAALLNHREEDIRGRESLTSLCRHTPPLSLYVVKDLSLLSGWFSELADFF